MPELVIPAAHNAERALLGGLMFGTWSPPESFAPPAFYSPRHRLVAEAILALRKTRPYLRVTQLLDVRGIGAKTLKRLKPYLTVTDAPTTAPGLSPTPKRS